MLAWKAAGKASQGLPVMGQRAEHAEEGAGHEASSSQHWTDKMR